MHTSGHCLDMTRYCLHTPRHCLKTMMIALYNGLQRKKMIHNDIIHSWKLFLHVLEHLFLCSWWPSDVDCSLIGWHKMSVTPELVTCCQVWCLYEIGMRILFSKQYRYVTNHLHLYVTNYYIFCLHSYPLTALYVPSSC